MTPVGEPLAGALGVGHWIATAFALMLSLSSWLPSGKAPTRLRKLVAVVSGLVGLGLLWRGVPTLPTFSEQAGFWTLASLTIAASVATISARNPVYSAIWFAISLLGTASLLFLQNAQFLGVATVAVYAGAIVVTFLFVIMLAQPNGAARYDRFAREGLLSAVTGLLLSGVLIAALHLVLRTEPRGPVAGVASRPADSVVTIHAAANRNSLLASHPHVAGLGRTLFTDQVVSVEITGLLLLAAVVGAMLIAGHRTEESHDRK